MRRLLVVAMCLGCAGAIAADFADQYPPGSITTRAQADQAIAAADAIERGLRRRDAEGLDTQRMGPVVTLMMGRVEDWPAGFLR